MDEFSIFLADKCSDYANILICGDFNFPKICWESPELTAGEDEVQFTELLNDHYLTQVNRVPTRGDHILDLVISSVPENVQNMSVLSPSQSELITDHSAITFDIATPFKARPKIKRTVFDYNRGNFNELRATLETVDLSGAVESAVDINHGWLKWKELFLSCVRGSIPVKTISNVNNPPWINGEIIHAIRKKETVRRKLKTSPTDVLRNKFKALRSKVKRLITESRCQFFENISESLFSNPKRLWSVFKINSKRASVPGTITVGSNGLDPDSARSASCPRDIAELFNDYFTSIVSGSDHTTPTDSPSSPTDCTLSELTLFPDDVLSVLLSLDINKATGPDEIPPKILKECAHQIAPSLCLLFNQSLQHGFIPKEWKLANIIPIHKKGDISNVKNYRPISLLSVISKVLERCVLRKLRDHLMLLISSAQHGFIPGRSCTTQLVEVLHYIGSNLDSGKQTDMIFMDMSKAFDKVSHTALINKLRNYNIGGFLLQWFTSYLHDRQQRVTTLGATSSQKPVCSGVPQGSILGPILFLLYVNDLPDALTNSTVACFADDTKIFRRIDSINDAILLQDDLNNLESWSKTSGLMFNEEKCKSISITRRRQSINHPYCIKGKELKDMTAEKDLGIWIASNLTWSKQVLDRCARANKLLGFVKRCSGEISDVRTRRTLYLSLVRSVFGYSSQVWSPQTVTLIQRVERVQRRATKYILNLPYLCSETYRERLVSLGLLPLSYWHEYLDLVFFFKAVNGLVDVSHDVLPELISETRTTRSSSGNQISFRPAKCKTSTYQRSFFIRATRTWNSLPPTLRSPGLNIRQFKTDLQNYYLIALRECFNENDPRTWKTICLKCNASRNLRSKLTCCF